MPDITFADISEFQENIDADAYIGGGHRAIICRVHNGYRPDAKIPQRAVYLRGKPFEAIGWYQYLAAGRDAATQAREYIATVGALRQNEFAILDLEEGAGDQTPRAIAWFRVVDEWAGFQASLYSGEAFLKYQLGGPSRWGKRPLWIASYPASYRPVPALEPPGCDWWQYSDRERFPGLAGGVDGSVFHGTAQQFLAAVRPTSSVAPVRLPGDEIVAVERSDGSAAAFVERAGEVFWAVRGAPTGRWSRFQSLGRPGGP